jgi:hypothetical protein
LGQDIDGIVAGEYHLCARTTSGEIFCWGGLSSAEEFSSRTPLTVGSLTGKTLQLDAGSGHTCALTTAGEVKCWGDNYFGQLGDGTYTSTLKPMNSVYAMDRVLKISSGSGHVCALIKAGDVRCWGDCSLGQCGDKALQWDWNPYENHKYLFSVDYPSTWNVVDTPISPGLTRVDQVWFSRSNDLMEQTGARPEVVLWIAQEDPTANWDPQFFDNFKEETIQLGNVSALRISGTNKESHKDEIVIIVDAGGYFIQAMPNQSDESLRFFDQILLTLYIDGNLVTTPGSIP